MIAPALLASTAIILLSFVSEDAATISSALSLFGGPVGWPLGFAACFTGIWLGDLGLYSLARCLGKPILQSRWVARFTDATAIERCQQNFSQRGSLALFVSRFVPGTRLPTYLAAGLFSMPLARFALVTALAAILWIGGIFATASLLGSHALIRFSFFQGKIAAVAGTTLLLGTILVVFKRLIPAVRGADAGRASGFATETGRGQRPRLQLPVFFRRWAHWEFWPARLFYIPVAVYYVWLAIRYRGLTVPTSANPGMTTGGFVGESKYEILQQLRQADADLVAGGYLIEGCTTTDRLLSLHRLCREHKIRLPFILKPDVGQRGNGVRLIQSMRAALEYLENVTAPVIVQRYIAGPFEAGIFYYRFPGESHGQIFAITEKEFPIITGDGTHTVEELIHADSRAALMARTYLRRFDSCRDQILAAGEILKLVETGNHAQGCIFRNGMHLHTNSLERAIDEISQKLPGFFIGRYDVRYRNEEDFKQGRNFQIVELNGATSEATSIYDARNSLLSAYRTLFQQWRLVFAIGAANRANGHAPSSLAALWRNWRQYSVAALSYPLAD
jgi:membrane protein DedA with SNARE-associated domain